MVIEYNRMQREIEMATKEKTTKKTATKDDFGLRKGTNTAKAATMFRKGATMVDVKAKTGSNQYNVLKWLEKQGHKITRKDGFITVTPKAEAA